MINEKVWPYGSFYQSREYAYKHENVYAMLSHCMFM